ncbi:MAG: beta-lactamase family protein [Deltaproteobacteria bacterium]|nr:beta-lactamase family protein [Deltaproteobacteria bacterium]
MQAIISAYLEGAVKNQVFPGCVLAYGHPAKGEVTYLWAGLRGLSRSRFPVSPDLVYDLASLTKILSTTFLIMLAVDQGQIELDWKLTKFAWPVPDNLKGLKVSDLLTHQSGLPAWRPYYLNKELQNRDKFIETILNEPKVSNIGEKTLYSDLNFLLLGFILETIFGQSLKDLFAEKIAQPLGLLVTGYVPKPWLWPVAPTEDGPRLGGPLDYPGLKILGPVPLGRVHDDNSAFLSGQAGHAGLFGSIKEVWLVLQNWAKSLSQAPEALVRGQTMSAFLAPRKAPSGPLRAMGFDLGLGPLRGSRGHLGYTGGSLWWDPDLDRALVLLTNRVHPTARNSQMEEFRKGLAQLLWG